ncbi:hypothetical protein NP233_g4511 [Leucocoprinus birnbaumii]|uniref:Uncharacterized protein n=1 Tax=Leucocoprinus birnbaumii TaxID=56174 RepID=A0AAD5VX90_9AGAR|nr:hypothetical protein NP233_g4511 [Leucocoprinus birnbaumii]
MSQSPHLTKHAAPRETTDSSSSRESSPERANSRIQRSFSPESQSSDTAAPQITVSDSSPQADHPVIRQGLAFRTDSSKHINTYEPSVKNSDTAFLPGQEVQPTASGPSSSTTSPVALGPPLSSTSSTPGPPPSSSNPATPSPHLSAMSTPSDKSTAQKGTKKATKPATKKPKQPDDASFTTGRFRLSQYSATPNEGPPVLHGQGPYASVYRTPVASMEGTSPGPDSLSSPVAPTAASTTGTRIILSDPSLKTRRTSKPQSIQPSMAPTQDEPNNTSPSQSRTRPGYPPRPPSSSQLPQVNTTPPVSNPSSRGSAPQPHSTSLPPMGSPGASHPSAQSTGYYRRNYEQDSQQAPRSEHSRVPSAPGQMNDPRSMDAMMAPPPGEPSGPQAKGKEREAPGQRQPSQAEPGVVRPPRGNIRLVTALIEDNRHNPPDHLLAEVYIRCWSGSRPEELWCDAKDLSEALQASASRIDGPAKVFTMRGAYRQCFLRITAEQEDRYSSMNLALASDRTIPISVEYWAPPGAQSKPGVDWRMPWHGSPTLSHPHAPPQSQYHSYQYPQVSPPQQQQQQHYSQAQTQNQQRLSPHANAQSQSPHPHYSQQHPDDGRHGLEPSRKRPSYNEQSSPEYPPTSPLRRAPFGAQATGHAHDPRYETPTLSRNPSSSYPRKRHFPDSTSPTENNAPGDGMDTRPDFKNSSYDSSAPKDTRQLVSDMIDELLSHDRSAANYNRFIQSPVLAHTVQAYFEVSELCKKYLGHTLPVDGNPSYKITEVDIARGLRAEDPHRFTQECRETLWLLELYGEKGRRVENPKVLEMLKETYRPDFSNVKPMKQLQKLLRDIDARWMQEHSEGGGENTRTTPRMT